MGPPQYKNDRLALRTPAGPPRAPLVVATVPRGGDEIEAALVHQRHHLVGGGGRLDVDLAARLLLEGGDPVIVLVGLASLDVARPGNDIDFAFTLAYGFGHFGKRGAAENKQGDE